MSRRNREKRAAKHRNRRRAKQERTGFDPGPDRALLLEHLVMALSTAASCPVDQVPRRATEVLGEYRGFARELAVAADLAMNEAIKIGRASCRERVKSGVRDVGRKHT